MIEVGRSDEDMEQVLTTSTQSSSSSVAKIINVLLWVLQIGAAGMFLMVGFLKLSGNPQLVGLFKAIGLGQWFRYLTGALELVAAVTVLIPSVSAFGALLMNSPLAIVLYLVMPTLWSVLGEMVRWLHRAAGWLDINLTSTPLSEPGMTGEQWARFGVAALVWVALPLFLGTLRVLRREVS